MLVLCRVVTYVDRFTVRIVPRSSSSAGICLSRPFNDPDWFTVSNLCTYTDLGIWWYFDAWRRSCFSCNHVQIFFTYITLFHFILRNLYCICSESTIWFRYNAIALKYPVWGCPNCILWGAGPGRFWAQSALWMWLTSFMYQPLFVLGSTYVCVVHKDFLPLKEAIVPYIMPCAHIPVIPLAP